MPTPLTFLCILCMYVQGLSFQTIQHAVTTTDVQLTVDGGLLVFVVGQLKVSGLIIYN